MNHDSDTSSHDIGLPGLSVSGGGFVLAPITAPSVVGEQGTLSFQILDADSAPLTEFSESHDKDLHLIVVRSDGDQFHHVHPSLNETTGIWSLPWTWKKAGSYRVYADFAPGREESVGMTLTRTVDVAGEYSPASRPPTRVDSTGDYSASIAGDLVAGQMTELTVSVSRGADPVTELELYLGAFGHLVALRGGDLAYLHVHPHAGDPRPGERSGPEITFMAQAPTAGRYLLYLDFQIDGQVHTVEFVLDAQTPTGETATDSPDH
ncbi:hypothetical protein [Microbacterium profundi]|uniref:hypothetical protein n=1 Tax=Microbacterium profundi TaxID=450380 RepID=UPI0006921255|nr:hypothetical protein [Microbacterium profundi]